MRSPALAMAWQLWNRHRLGLLVSAACIVVMVAAFPPLLRAFPAPYVLVATTIPPVLIFVYLANLLMFADEVGSLTSGYPRRMFTLPVTTATLVFWPMLIAVVALMSLWFLVSLLVYYPAGYRPPLVLPAMALAVIMAWNQAICWSPVRTHVVRLYAAIIGFGLLLGAPFYLFLQKQASSAALTVLGLCELLSVCGIALLAVSHDRRGDDWAFGLGRVAEWCLTTADRFSKQPASFHGVADAQFWYESRCHGLMLKGSIYFVIFWIFLLCLPVPQGKTLAMHIGLGCMLGTPFMMGSSSGASLGRMRPVWSKQRGFITFQAMRPILTGDMIDAKYRLVARCVMQIWAVDLVMTGTLVVVKRQTGEVASLFRSFMEIYPGWRWATILVLVIGLAPIFSWKLMTDSLVPVLTGRRWIADTMVFLNVIMFMLMIAAGLWVVLHPDPFERFLPVLIWLMALVVIVKLLMAVLLFRRAVRRGLISSRSVARIALIWAAMALATLTLAQLLVPATGLAVARPVMLVGTLSLLPLGRFALAPLALDWNRHR